ncbi:MAG: molybdopterin molybdotransferase MoeA [Rhizobiaceae bacterium]|nr:molybdopterin molybdotransferase MoeA [Rhizobiaceae bacterium]
MALLPVDDALARLLAGAETLPAEHAALHDAAWRVLAQPIAALRTQPPFDASAMDGYAVRAADIAALPASLSVIGEAPAGRSFGGSVGPGEAVRIFTGAPVPEGADTILLQEDARRSDDGKTVEALESTAKGRHVRKAGLDFRDGDALLPAGRVLDPAALSLAAAANHATLPVVARPRVAILATGDELLPPGSDPGPDQIIASNGYGVAALVRADGGEPLDLGIAPDRAEAIAAAVERARQAGAHVIVTLGGASVGDHDLVHEVLTSLGMTLDFWKIAMRPGKPLMVGKLDGVHVLGLPGNPVSSLVCAHLFLRPLLAKLGGREFAPDIRDAVLGEAMKANDHRRDYVRARVEDRGGKMVTTPFPTQDSSMLRTLAEANCLIVREANAPAGNAGEFCKVLMLR